MKRSRFKLSPLAICCLALTGSNVALFPAYAIGPWKVGPAEVAMVEEGYTAKAAGDVAMTINGVGSSLTTVEKELQFISDFDATPIASITNSGTLYLYNSAVVTSAGKGTKAISIDTGGTLAATGAKISIGGESSSGVSAGSGSVNLTMTLIETLGAKNLGVEVQSGIFQSSDLTVNSSNGAAAGIDLGSDNTGLVTATIRNSTLNMQDGAAGSAALRIGSANVNAKGLQVTATGTARGIQMLQGTAGATGDLILDKGVSIPTVITSEAGDAIYLSGGTATLGDIQSTATAGGHALNINENVTANATLGSYTSTGASTTEGSASAVLVANGGGLTLTDASVDAQGAGAAGVMVSGGTLGVAGGTLKATGADASALLVTNTQSALINNVTLDGTALSSALAEAIRINQADLTLNIVNGSNVTGGNGILLTSAGTEPFTANVTADNKVNLVGDIQALAGVVNLSLKNTSSLTGAVHSSGDLSVDTTSKWSVTGDSTVAGLNNSGQVEFNHTSEPTFPAALKKGHILHVIGNYAGGGTLIFNTVLGDDSSVTDRLNVDGDTSGTTTVTINNAGGSGAKTLTGIELVHVKGLSAGEFIHPGRIVAGAYDYVLQRGTGADAGNWYLVNKVEPEPKPDVKPDVKPITPPVNPDNGGSVVPPVRPPVKPAASRGVRPEAGIYTANIAAANTLFNTRLHDRLGETHYVDALSGQQKVTSMWMRHIGGHSRFHEGNGELNVQSNRYVLQIGGDVAQWSSDYLDRFHLGVMAGYARQSSNSDNHVNSTSAGGSIEGYSTGLYATWLQDEGHKTGAYVDSWVQYSWFHNNVNGSGLPGESYKSKGFTASLESGYTWMVSARNDHESLYVQPKFQVTWMGVKADEHREHNGTRVSSNGNDNIQTRAGVRTFIKSFRDGSDKGEVFEPFVEANWLYNSKAFGTTMNSVEVSREGGRNVGELKLGVEGQINPQLNIWGNVAHQVGKSGYQDSSLILGVKVNF